MCVNKEMDKIYEMRYALNKYWVRDSCPNIAVEIYRIIRSGINEGRASHPVSILVMDELVGLEVGETWLVGLIIVGARLEQQGDGVLAAGGASAHAQRPAMAQAPAGVALVIIFGGFQVPG